MLNSKNYITEAERYLYGVLIVFISGAILSATIRLFTGDYWVSLIDVISLCIGYFIIYDFEKRKDISTTVVYLFWLASLVIFIFVIYFQFSLHLLLILLVPLAGSMLLEYKRFIYHGSLFLFLFTVMMVYGFAHKDQYIYLNNKDFLITFFILLFFVVGLSFVYNQSIKRHIKNLKEANDNQKFLLKEMHHRVKNNLNIVASILGLEKYETNNEEVHHLIEQNKLRIESIAMIHEILYKHSDLEHIEFDRYVTKLSAHILDTEMSHHEISLNFDMIPLELEIESMIQFGIIVNELMTNSIKYAFPSNKGRIMMRLKKEQRGYLFTYQDDGVGAQSVSYGFGHSLIEMSVLKLKAKLSVSYSHGIEYQILFNGDGL